MASITKEKRKSNRNMQDIIKKNRETTKLDATTEPLSSSSFSEPMGHSLDNSSCTNVRRLSWGANKVTHNRSESFGGSDMGFRTIESNGNPPQGFNSLVDKNKTTRIASGSASPTNQPIRVPPPKPVRAVARNTSSPLFSSKRSRPLAIELFGDSSNVDSEIHSSPLVKKTQRRIAVNSLHDDILAEIFSYIVETDDVIKSVKYVSKLWNTVSKKKVLWKDLPFIRKGHISPLTFQFLGLKTTGTEGKCYKIYHRGTGKLYALKKARVYPKGEGVPYYMLRELAFLQNLKHPHIATLERIALVENELFVFFNYIEKTLFDLINPVNDVNGGVALPAKLTKRLLFQILTGVAFCHERGVLHRNIKPKHLLVDMKSFHRTIPVAAETRLLDTVTDAGNVHEQTSKAADKLLSLVEEASIKISDFALVRSTSIPLRNYTSEVVTLWYRAPEILMGGEYFAAVDMWSVGCVFGEMVLGKPLFPGICEVDQLFQIFNRLGTPSESTWKGFTSLPNYQFKFPNWKSKNLSHQFPGLEPAGIDLLSRLLTVDPARRITANEALEHRYFDEVRNNENVELTQKTCTSYPLFDTNAQASCRSYKTKAEQNWNVEVIKNAGSFRDYSKRVSEGLADTAYLPRYYGYLKTLESRLFPLEDYLANRQHAEDKSTSTLQPQHRSMLVDWLVEVIDVFDMSLRSVFLAVNYTDRYLSKKTIDRKSFQLLGATCLHIASKCEDVSYIGVDDLVVCADRVYSAEEVLRLEEDVLNVLDFQLAIPTVIDFLNAFIERLKVSVEKEYIMLGLSSESTLERQRITELAIKLAKYITELSLQEQKLISKYPSEVAASALILAVYYCEIPVIGSHIYSITGYKLKSLKWCVSQLRRAHLSSPVTFNLTVIRKRYQKPENLCAANVPAKQSLTGIQWDT